MVDGENGTILNHYTYDAFGNTTHCEEQVYNRFRYNGEQYDPVTSQYYLRARFYNPAIARFTQKDTYYGDGLNLYAYCHNNPVGYVDPSGHICQDKYQSIEYLRKTEGLTAQEALERYNLYHKANPELSVSELRDKIIGAETNQLVSEICNARATEINQARGGRTSRMGTTAVMQAFDNQSGKIVYLVSTNEPNKNIPRKLRSILNENEVYIGGKGHAEETIMKHKGNNYTIIAGGTSRNVCIDICKSLLEKDGLALGGPRYRGRQDKTPYRQFWRENETNY